MRKILEGTAPTYAYELEKQGHAGLSMGSSPEDPLYLSLISRQIDWLARNPLVNDIYTMRKRADGKIVLFVDSETDYDKDSAYAGEREQRTPIGEVFEEAGEQIERAFAGQATFESEPYADRWGVWVSAFVPMKDAQGKVEAILGVDFSADEWNKIVLMYRGGALGFFAVLVVALIMSTSVVIFVRLESDHRLHVERALKESQKMEAVGSLASGIAHDLNNQLTPLLGYLELMLQDEQVSRGIRPFLADMKVSADHCRDVVQKLQNFARPSGEQKDFLPLQVILKDAARSFSNFFPPNVKLETHVSSDLPPVLGNEAELLTVLMNLGSNARDAMPDGGTLTLEAERMSFSPADVPQGYNAGTYVRVRVSDSGHGVRSEHSPKIFEPFFTTRDRNERTGLGLSIASNVLKDHGGWIQIASTSPRGTTFEFFLPAEPGAALVKAPVRGSSSALKAGHETVLFVDDEDNIRQMGQLFLTKLGYKVLQAQDGESALSIFAARSGEIGAVILDMTMPKLSGKRTLKRLLEIDPAARIIISSGYTEEGSAKDLVAAGAVDFLHKPYTIHALATVLRNALDRS